LMLLVFSLDPALPRFGSDERHVYTSSKGGAMKTKKKLGAFVTLLVLLIPLLANAYTIVFSSTMA